MAEIVHMVAFPFPLQGHIAPLLHLVHSLLAHPSVIISFVTSDSHAKVLLNSKQEWYWQGIHPESELRILGLPDTVQQRSGGEWINEKGEWLGSMDAVFSAFFANFKMEPLLRALLQKLQEETITPKISCIIADVSSCWVQSLASDLGIPFAALCTFSASFLVSCMKVRALYERGYIPIKGYPENRIINLGVPGLDGTRLKDLPFNFHEEDPRDPGFSTTRDSMSQVRGADLFLLNSCEALEGEVIEYLKRDLSPSSVIPVGPLLSIPLHSGGSEAGLWEQDRRCLAWLDGKPEGSVIYASFGSGSDFTFDEIRILAEGIEASGCFFLWVVRKHLVRGAPEDFFPEFDARTEGRGLVISWSPQPEVLSHRAVGGFITHCGWNSCMESLLAGVPMLALPRFVDQSLNARLVCDDWKVGKRLNPGGGELSVAAVVQGIRSLMDAQGEGADMRARARSFHSSLQASRCKNHLSSLLKALS